MFSGLRENSLFYVLSENGRPKLEVGKVVEMTTRPKMAQHQAGYIYGQNMETVVDVTVKVDDGEPYKFKDLPAGLSRVCYTEGGVVVADSYEALCPDIEAMEKRSRGIVESAPYHEEALLAIDEIKVRMNPKLKAEREQAERIDVMEQRIGTIEKNLSGGFDEMKNMMLQLLSKGNNKNKSE